jgi:predicted nuclease with TOPRIM domain
MEAVEKVWRLAHTLVDMDEHESVSVHVKVIREIAEAMSQLDTERRARQSLEEDLVELQTQRTILSKTNEALNTEVKHLHEKIDSIYLAVDDMRDRWLRWEQAGELTLMSVVMDFASVMLGEYSKWFGAPDEEARITGLEHLTKAVQQEAAP